MEGNDEMTEVWERGDQPEEDFENASNENTSKEERLIKMIVTILFFIHTNCYLVVKVLDFQSRGPISKTTW